MKNALTIGLVLTVFLFGCSKEKKESKIFHASVNQEFVLIRDVAALQNSTDSISLYVDSILSGLINETIISTGYKSFDLNNNKQADLHFEIIDLNNFNQQLPAYLDSMAARVIPVTLQVLDNSTYGYPDALNENYDINHTGNWSSRTSVLGTFMNAGQFQGQGEKYLAIRLATGSEYNYGWVKLYCSQHNDTLRIIEYAYNTKEGKPIKAGQKN